MTVETTYHFYCRLIMESHWGSQPQVKKSPVFADDYFRRVPLLDIMPALPGPSADSPLWSGGCPREYIVEDTMGRTLVVDDFATMRKIGKNVLRQIDITDVAEAENGKMALDILKKNAAVLTLS